MPSVYTNLSQGQHTLHVQSISQYGIRGTIAQRTWTVIPDTDAPVTTIFDAPSGQVEYVEGMEGIISFLSEAGTTFECSLDNEPFTECESPYEFADLAIGPHNFRVRATDLEGNTENPPAIASWEIIPDTTAPQTFLHAKPPATTTDINALFTFSSNEFGVEFECALDDETLEGNGCETPMDYQELAFGSHTFTVRAIDLADPPNVDPTPETYTWFIEDPSDGTLPVTLIHDGPPATTNSVLASFMFTSEIGATFECQVDTEPIEECESPYEVELDPETAAGQHTFRVRATDLGLNVGEWATYEWTIVGPPETFLDETPPATGAPATATFEFSSDQGNAIFFCALDGAELQLCSSPKTYSNLIDGEHTFEVAARNPLGDSDETPAEYLWSVAVAPDTFINSKPTDPTTSTVANFTFTASEIDSTFECMLDNSEWVECEVPIDPPFSGLTEGSHNFKVRATDEMGNVDPTPAEYTWVIDFLPNTTVAASIAGTTATFTFTSSDAGSTFQCRIDGGAWTVCSSPKEYTDLLVGGHNFSVRAIDPVGNVDDTPATWVWTVTDAIAPDTDITGTQTGSMIISFTGTDNHSATAALTFQCRLDSGAWVACTSPKTYTDAELAAGPHTFEVRAIDEAGNVDATPDAHSWTTADTVEPNTTIGTKPEASSPNTSGTFTFGATDNWSPVSALTYQCRLDSAAVADWDPCSSPKTYHGLGVGSHTFEVRATDAAGNVETTPATYTWTVLDGDITASDTVLGQRPPLTTTANTATFEFTATEAGSTFECKLDTGAWAACTTPKTYTGLSVATHTFQVRAVDAAQNRDPSPASYTWTVQAAAPPANCGSQQTLTANADAWIDQGSPSSNKGTDSNLKVMSKGNSNDRALVRFLLPTMPAGCHVQSATLRLYASSARDGRTIQALLVGQAWSETTVTWANAPTTTGSAVTASSGTGYRDWNVAAMVTTMYSSGNHNGFLVRDANENQDAEQQYSSREKGSNLPQLVLQFAASAPTPPPPTGDTTPPDTSISQGPSTSVTSRSATLRFESPEPSMTFQCRLDSLDESAFTACSSPVTYAGPLALGSHRFEVRAIDAAGNKDQTPALHTWTITSQPNDTVAPQTTLTATPPATTLSKTATFEFSTNETDSTFECKLDTADFAACSSPVTLSNLSVATHTFQVRAKDLAGNVDASPASYTWTVEAPPPVELRPGADGRRRARTRGSSRARRTTTRAATRRSRWSRRAATTHGRSSASTSRPSRRAASSTRRCCASGPAATRKAGRSRSSAPRAPGARAA